MDHITICLAETANAVLIDYASHSTRLAALPNEPFAWVTFFTKPADKGREIMIEYNERAAVSRLLIPAIIDSWESVAAARHSAWVETRRMLAGGSLEAFEAAHDLFTSLPATISIETVRNNYPDTFGELERSFPALLDDKQRWPLKIRVRGLHHLGEAKRVALATTKLDSLQHDKDPGYTFSAMQTLGKLLNESHASLRDLYEVSVPEVEELIKIVREDPHVLGARVMGGGFGGNVLALTTRDHSHDLIKRVQDQYYSARGRDGVNEGSVIVSTPGRGLSDIDLNHLWGELIDAHSVTFDPQDIQPVIVAAGKGSRAAESGLNVPKPVAIIGEQPAIVHVLRSIREGLGTTPTPVVIVSPDTEAAIREALRGEDVVFVTQQQALGTGDAVLNAHGLLSDFTGMSLVVWSTQPVIRPKTYARTAKLARLFESYEMVLPTAFVARPYAPLKRNASGAIESAAETHLENAETAEFGETNIGLFLLKNQTMFQVLLELRSRYWDEAAGRYNRSRGELGFPNEVINALASRKFGVFASPFADAREEQGIKRADDLSRCERFLVQLNEESLD